MNWSEGDPEAPVEHADEVAETAGAALFHGDTGSLPLGARRALCQLLAGPSIDARRHSQLWPALLREETVIRARLSELFLELVLDRDLGVAFVRQAELGELDAPTLLRASPLTFIDSVLLLDLRRRLAEAEARGDRAAVEEAELVDALSVYERSQRTDRAGYAKRVAAAIEKMKKASVLQRIRGSEQRYEIAPTLKLLFSAEDVAALIEVYRDYREGRSAPPERSDADSDDDEDAA